MDLAKTAPSTIFMAIPLGARQTPMLRICLQLFRHTSQVSSVEELLCLLDLYCPTKNTAAQLHNNYCAVLPYI